MNDLNTETIFSYRLPTNVNGVINSVNYLLSRHGITAEKDEIKEYYRSLKIVDFHVFPNTVAKSDYWISRCCRIAAVYGDYIEDTLTSFGLTGIYVTDSDVNYTLYRLFKRNYPGGVPKRERERIYDRDYVMRYVAGDLDPYFNLYDAIASDQLDKFIPRIYGGKRLRTFDSVCNTAYVPFVLTDKVYSCMAVLWEENRKSAADFFRDCMKYYFHEESIANLLRYMKNHVKAPYRYNTMKEYKAEHIYKSYDYTTTGQSGKIEHCKEYFRWYIETCYRTKQDLPAV